MGALVRHERVLPQHPDVGQLVTVESHRVSGQRSHAAAAEYSVLGGRGVGCSRARPRGSGLWHVAVILLLFLLCQLCCVVAEHSYTISLCCDGCGS